MHKKGTRWSPEDKEAIPKARAAGKSDSEIGKENGGVTKWSIRQVAGPRGSRSSSLNSRLEQVEKFLAEGLNDRQMAERLDGIKSLEYVGRLRRMVQEKKGQLPAAAKPSLPSMFDSTSMGKRRAGARKKK